MKLFRSFSILALAVGFLAITGTSAFADDCTRLGGVISSGECRVSTAVSKSNSTAPGGPFTIGETLRITSTGKITIPKAAGGNSLTINITGGLIMEAGSQIIGDAGASPNDSTAVGATITINATGNILLAGTSSVTGNPGARISSEQQAGSAGPGGRGGNITLTSSGGNITTEDGSVISANALHNPAGDIVITTIPSVSAGTIDIDGQVLSQSGLTGTGTNQRPGGGRITIKAGCELQVSDTGVVSSSGLDPGADLVHLEACSVLVHGLVESTGHGHAIPNSPANHCNLDPVAHPIGSGPSTDFTGCVEVWSGTTITVLDDAVGNNGEINADIPGPGGTKGRGWIDVFARGDIRFSGLSTPYVVHANGGLFQNTDDGGLITVKSFAGQVFTVGNAIQANSTSAGGKGGDVIVQAGSDVNFGTASIQAKGSTGAPASAGGHISARSFNGSITGSVPGELNTFGPGGTVLLEACVADPALSYAGNVTGTETDHGPGAPYCGGNPSLPAGVPDGTCTSLCVPHDETGGCEKAAVQSVLNPLTGRFLGNKGPDLTFRLDLGHDEDGNTSIQQMIDNAVDKNGDSYIILMVLKDGTGVLGGSTSENLVINRAYLQRFALVGCSVTVHAADTNLPAGNITPNASSPAASPDNIFVMDLHGAGSGVAGWKVEGNKRYMRNVATNTSAVGMWFVGNNNTMHNGNGINNSTSGILVQGSSNTVDSSDVFGNLGNGVTVVGGSNKILKVDAGDKNKGNGGDGVNVTGNSNTIQEVDAYANNGNGIWVLGGSNKLLKNNLGDRNKFNLLDGILVSGSGNTIQENDAYANGGNGINVSGGVNTLSKNTAGDRGDKANGLAGFLLSGGGSLSENEAIGNLGDGFHLLTSGFSLTKNVSGGTGSGQPNGGCQYNFAVAGNTNAGSNKSNNVTLTGTPFPAGCK